MNVAAKGFRVPCQRVKVHSIDVVLMGVEQHSPAHGELALLVVHQQQAVVPAVSPRLVHNGSDVAGGRVEVTHIQERRVMLVSTPQQRLEFDHHLTVERNDGRSTGAVHTLGVHYRGNKLLPARIRVQDKERLVDGLFGQPFTNVTELCFIGARLFH
ncbi:hypothetical protein ES703_69446 [subsurface metagenome]